MVDGFDLPGFEMFAWDARGHGRSPGERGWAAHFGVLAHDADAFLRHLGSTHGYAPEEVAVVAQSVGAVTAAAWLHDFAPRVRCAVLAAPAFQVKLYVPLARPGLRLMHAMRGNFFVKSYVKAFRGSTYAPSGITDDSEIRTASSITDYIFRRLALDYLSFDDRLELGELVDRADERERS